MSTPRRWILPTSTLALGGYMALSPAFAAAAEEPRPEAVTQQHSAEPAPAPSTPSEAEVDAEPAATPADANGTSEPASQRDVDALRAELKVLREELARSRQAPETSQAEREPKQPVPAPTQPASVPADEAPKPDLLPIEFAAFGDFFYRLARGEHGAFGIGTVEVDASLRLTPYVAVSTAIGYNPASAAFELPAFVIDCGLAGKGDGFVLQSSSLLKSGVSFGKFDVPIGIAYLEYPSVANRLVSLPQAVLHTHAAWNDLGVQAYAVGEHWSVLGYAVNGPELPVDAETTKPAVAAFGGRAAGRLEGVFEVGGSVAGVVARSGPPGVFAGGDLAATFGPLDVHAEYLLKHVNAPGVPDNTQGIYARAMVDMGRVFAVARFDTLIERRKITDRCAALGAAVEVFTEGEVRAVYEHSFDSGAQILTLQLVGGSTFQPTGLRR